MRSSCASLSVLPKCSIGATLGSGVAGGLGRGTFERLRFTTIGLGDESLSSITTTRFFRRLTTTTGERSASCSVAEELLSLLDGWRFFLGRATFDCTLVSSACFAGGPAASADCFAIVFLLRDPGGRPGLRLGFGAHERSTTGGESSTGSQALSGISSSTVGNSAVDIYICIFLSVTWLGEDHLEADLVVIETHDVALEVSDSEAEMLQHSVCAIY